jgi:hypothetical protein
MKGMRWYVSHEILLVDFPKRRKTEKTIVWENIVLIKADNADEAFEKALAHGKLSEEKILVDGKEGFMQFKGLKELSWVYEELEDGSEIEWCEYRISENQANKLLRSKETMQAFRAEEDEK